MTEEYKNLVESAFEQMDALMEHEVLMDDGDNTHLLVSKGKHVHVVSNNKDRPTRKKGSKSFTSAKSFCHYVNKHKSEDETVIIADEDKSQVKAIINDNGVDNAAWSDFTAELKIKYSKQWIKWFENSNSARDRYFDQSEFADFLEDNRADFMCGKGEGEKENVTALELGSIITNLQQTSQEKFSSKTDPVTGKVKFSYENEEIGKGNVEIPKQFIIVIPVYRSGDLFKITIRLRHRITGGSAKFYYIIDEVESIKKKAFDMVCNRIENGFSEFEDSTGPDDYKGTEIEVYQGII